jgi:hypothetical protein
MMLSIVDNKITFLEHKTGVFRLSVLQLLTNYRISKCVHQLYATI